MVEKQKNWIKRHPILTSIFVLLAFMIILATATSKDTSNYSSSQPSTGNVVNQPAFSNSSNINYSPTNNTIITPITPPPSSIQNSNHSPSQTPPNTTSALNTNKPSPNTPSSSGQSNLYPDHSLTPGDLLTTDSSIVCQSGYSSTIRSVSTSEKKQVYAEYGISYPQPTGVYEVDHFIPLELGGSNSITNLWPEPANPIPGFHEKDLVENYLHKIVCNGTISLQEAQQEISTDWYKVYLQMNS